MSWEHAMCREECDDTYDLEVFGTWYKSFALSELYDH